MASEYLSELGSIRKSSRELRSTSHLQWHMVIVRLVLQPTLCGIGCRQILGMRRLLKMFSLF